MCKRSRSSHGTRRGLDEVVSSEVFLAWEILALLGQSRTMVLVLAPHKPTNRDGLGWFGKGHGGSFH
jgi:hypothetical protein